MHAEQTIQALKNGKDVLCEKPMATTTRDAKKMIDVAKRTKKVLMIASHSRYYSEILDFLANKNRYGEIIEARADFLENLLEYTAESWFYDKKKAGGGCIIDSGINALDCLKSILGKLKIANARAKYAPLQKKKIDVETSAEIDFEFGRNEKGKIKLSWVADKEKRDITLVTADNKKYVINYLSKSKTLGDFMVQEYVGVLNDFLKRLKKGNFVDRGGLEILTLVLDAYKLTEIQ